MLIIKNKNKIVNVITYLEIEYIAIF